MEKERTAPSFSFYPFTLFSISPDLFSHTPDQSIRALLDKVLDDLLGLGAWKGNHTVYP